MVKVFSPPKCAKNSKTRVSIRIQKEMKEEIAALLQRKGLSVKKRSQWICTTLVDLAARSDSINCINEEWLAPGVSALMQVTLDAEAHAAINQLCTVIKDSPQQKEDAQSAVIRTAITQALIKEELQLYA